MLIQVVWRLIGPIYMTNILRALFCDMIKYGSFSVSLNFLKYSLIPIENYSKINLICPKIKTNLFIRIHIIIFSINI